MNSFMAFLPVQTMFFNIIRYGFRYPLPDVKAVFHGFADLMGGNIHLRAVKLSNPGAETFLKVCDLTV